MPTKEKIKSITGYILVMIITVVVGSFAISYAVKQGQKCSSDNPGLCTTKDACEKNNLYWWGDCCNVEEPKCNKFFLYLCDTKEVCENNDLNWWDNQCNIEKKPKPKASEYPDYYNIKGDDLNTNIHQLLITKDCPSGGCVNNKPATIDFDGIKKDYKVIGSFSRAYLYIEAMVDYNRPLSIWDDIYFNIFNKGGHLIPDDNLLLVPASDSSVYLYDMRSISYYPEIDNKKLGENKKEDQDLFDTLKDKRTIRIHTSLSSDRPGRVLKEVSIYYECTVGSNCSIEPIIK